MGELLVDQSCVVGRSPWPCSGRAPGSWRWRRCRAVATGRVESGHRVMVSWATHSTSHRNTHSSAHRRAHGTVSSLRPSHGRVCALRQLTATLTGTLTPTLTATLTATLTGPGQSPRPTRLGPFRYVVRLDRRGVRYFRPNTVSSARLTASTSSGTSEPRRAVKSRRSRTRSRQRGPNHRRPAEPCRPPEVRRTGSLKQVRKRSFVPTGRYACSTFGRMSPPA